MGRLQLAAEYGTCKPNVWHPFGQPFKERMKNESNIIWTDFTLNPWIGCTRVSPACLHCYAAEYGSRFGIEWGAGKPRRQTKAWQTIARALNVRKQRCEVCGTWLWNKQAAEHVLTCSKHQSFITSRKPSVFCGSLMDVFDQEVDPDWRKQLFTIIAECTNLFWLLLTKRPAQMLEQISRLPDLPWDNVALGVTAENQDCWDHKVPILMGTPARMRFVSVEPMLGPINPRGIAPDWVIIGGESGPRARPTNIEWIRALRNSIRSQAGSTQIMIKQLGSAPISNATREDVQLLEDMRDKSGANPAEWPRDLLIQEVIRQLHSDSLFVSDLQRRTP